MNYLMSSTVRVARPESSKGVMSRAHAAKPRVSRSQGVPPNYREHVRGWFGNRAGLLAGLGLAIYLFLAGGLAQAQSPPVKASAGSAQAADGPPAQQPVPVGPPEARPPSGQQLLDLSLEQ